MLLFERILIMIAGGAFVLAAGFTGALGSAERIRERRREEQDEPGLRVLRRRVTNWSLLVMLVAGTCAWLVERATK